MENLAASILFVFIVFFVYCTAAYSPKPTAAKPVNDFLEPEPTEPVIAVSKTKPQQPKPVTVSEPLPASVFKTGQKPSVQKDLSSLSIRQLYVEAKAKGIKRYKSKSKAVLLSELNELD
jgi:hypothetical protein